MFYRQAIFLSLSISLVFPPVIQAQAQLLPDNTLGKENSVTLPINSLEDKINGGAIRGNNLFHSFKEFNIDSGRSVYFNNPSQIQNILTRVTGSNQSQILGKLGVLGNANLFLINPNGIIFGKDASLDIKGSFWGRVLINAKGIFGTQFREFITPKSDITATSGLGAEFNGVVDINTITTTPNSGLIELPNNLTNSSQKIAAKCGESRVNKFTVTGRGGLPESPNQLFRGGIILVDLVDLVPASKNQQNSISSISRINNSIDNSNNNTEKEIVEAKGWIVDAQGNIEFVAEVPNFISNSGTITQPDCQTFG